jgi:regulator of cell morphogenesis and NO signaling
MQIIDRKTVAEIAAGSLAAVRVFENLGIDYCCGGKIPLEEACRAKGISTEQVQSALDEAMAAGPRDERDWTTAPLRDLVAHIIATHHAYLKRELGPLGERINKVERVYSKRPDSVDGVAGLSVVYNQFASELSMHMRKEEIMLFPAIEASEIAAVAGQPMPFLPFGAFANPVRMMEMEHDNAGNALARLRGITRDFAVPDYACVTYRAMISGLRELEQDLHVHVHLENNILFPRALDLER